MPIRPSYFSLLLVAIALLCGSKSAAQNLQLHYDFGHFTPSLQSRSSLTATLEGFHPDRYGSTFYFVDFNFPESGKTLLYGEVAREIKWWRGPVSLHVEYNGGYMQRAWFGQAALLGATYTHNAPDFHSGWSLILAYKHHFKHDNPAGAQLTGTWYRHFGRGKWTFTGFADLSLERDATDKAYACLLTEPQLWFNLNRVKGVPQRFNLSVGSELEISYNFPYENRKLYAVPTLGLKWTFQ
ncbi:MAG: DUF5020 family protein [Bacteroidaceae bacterium]|nr:DUF5020 family protein [Bacteroidaceae bacterium]